MSLDISTPAQIQALMGSSFAPSEQQWAAIAAPLQPGVVIAGAGSGKTTLMAARVVYLVATGRARPEQVLGLTFTTKAAAELRSRIRDALAKAGLDARDDEDEVLEPTVLTYNAYAAQLVREHGLRIGHEPDTRVMTDASRYQLGARVVDRYRAPIRELTDHPPTAIQNLLALDGAMSEHLVSAGAVRAVDAESRAGFKRALDVESAGSNRKTYKDDILKAISAIDRRGELLGLVESYRRAKHDLGLMDFADQISLGAQLAAEHPEVGALERERFPVVLLDEYQDTSVAQARMLAGLFSGPDAERGRGHAVMAVGDPHQAIYGWRGASASNILTFGASFPPADGELEILPLTVNRRSRKRILEVANTLAEPLYRRAKVVQPLEAASAADDGIVEARVFTNQDDELAWVAAEVKCAHSDDVSWADIAVLTRDNKSAERCFDALTSLGVPVEIVGLAGLLRLPEIAEVVATLTLLDDVTANHALVTLLTGPRWAIGPRDLKLLGSRAHELAGHGNDRELEGVVGQQLAAIADGADPVEVPALCDALDDLGEAPYSDEARERFGRLAAELRTLRSSTGEPLLDLVRRVIETSGVEVELASAASPAAVARRDNLDAFVKAVADFQSIDGDVSLAALLAYLTAEDDQGNGLDLATPSEADSVKLLTVHRAKGLEWHTVFLVGMCENKFPSAMRRNRWTGSPAVLPAMLRGDAVDLPQLQGFDRPALKKYAEDSRDHELDEELRLVYVAVTRAAERLVTTSHLSVVRNKPVGASEYHHAIRDQIRSWGIEVPWLEPQALVTATDEATTPLWPPASDGDEIRRRRTAARLVEAAIQEAAAPEASSDPVIAGWDADIEKLLAERAKDAGSAIDVPLPRTLSATAVLRLREDPEAFVRALARPMPRAPAPQARLGIRFHAWVEARFGQALLLDPDDLPGRGDLGIEDESDLRDLTDAFEKGPFAQRVPHLVEAPFSLVVHGQVVRGRIDAVYAEPDGGYLVVDWKTGRAEGADPLQLSLYRLAWAQIVGVPVGQVRAGFYFVRSGEFLEPELVDETVLVELFAAATAG